MQAARDQNYVTTLLAVSSVDGVTPVTLYANPTTHRLLVDLAGGGSGTVQTISIASANGFAGTSDGNVATPTLTISTSITGILKGNGTAISAVTIGSGLSYDGTTLSASAGGGNVSNTGTPVNNQIAVWTDASTIEGTTALTFDTGVLSVVSGSNYVEVSASATRGYIDVSDASSLSRVQIQAQDGASYISIQDTSAAATGPNLELFHDSASPAASDTVGTVYFRGRDGAAGSDNYATIKGVITDPTSTSEDGKIVFNTIAAGTEADRIEITGTTTTGILQSAGNTDLLLQTGNASTGGIRIYDGAGGNISVEPEGTGNIYLISDYVSVQDNGGVEDIGLDVGPGYVQIVGNDGSSGSKFDLKAASADTYLSLTDTSTGAVGPYLELYHNSASPAANDAIGFIKFSGEDSAGNKQQYARIDAIITDTTSTSEDGKVVIAVATAGTVADELELTGAALYPTTNDGLALGNATNQFSDLFLAEGGVINWDNGDATLTQAGNDVTLAGAALTARITKRTGTTTSSATPTINTDTVDEYYITAQTVDITSFTTNLSGTPTLGQTLFISVIGTAARAITWGASFGNGPVALPTTTVTTTELSVLFKYDGSIWRCYASGSRV